MGKKRPLNLFLALLPILMIIVSGLFSVLFWETGMNIPIMLGIITAALIGSYTGIKWGELSNGLINGVSRALIPIFIMIIVGMIIASWIQGGVIPTLIYYSLKVVSPQIFVPAAAFVTAVIATGLGTSLTSIATIGLALMTTGIGLGFPPALLAGAIISGAFFGDSLSPMSDNMNLGSAMNQVKLYELIRHMLKTNLPAMGISLIVFYFLALPYANELGADLGQIQAISEGLQHSFVISPWLLLVPLSAFIFTLKGVPALPSLMGIAFLGAIVAVAVQGESVGEVVKAMTSGYVSETGVELVDALLSRGGIHSMGSTIILLIEGVALGGILEEIGALDYILKRVLQYVNSDGRLTLVTVLSSLLIGFSTGEQYITVMLPARMYQDAYIKRGLHPLNLSRTAVSIGAVCINLVPWSVTSLFSQNVLGVSALSFIPYIIFAYAILGINLLFGYTGWGMLRLDDKEETV